ncbi:MAG: hypothetical protein CK538_04250 [Opitutia bacterium]|nr:MAG: hypothetical protein CK538_04250 [Opitutae bacterium]
MAATATPVTRATWPSVHTSSISDEGYALQFAPNGAPSRDITCGRKGARSPSEAALMRAKISNDSPAYSAGTLHCAGVHQP